MDMIFRQLIKCFIENFAGHQNLLVTPQITAQMKSYCQQKKRESNTDPSGLHIGDKILVIHKKYDRTRTLINYLPQWKAPSKSFISIPIEMFTSNAALTRKTSLSAVYILQFMWLRTQLHGQAMRQITSSLSCRGEYSMQFDNYLLFWVQTQMTGSNSNDN